MLNKSIKREFRSNVRRLQAKLADEFAGGNPAHEGTIMKRALALEQQPDIAPVKVDPDKYTDFMQSLQPCPSTTTAVTTRTFNVPDSFWDTLLRAIHALKAKKSPGPDLILLETFRIDPPLFADAALELLRAMGRTATVPPMFYSSLLSPIYKKKGDPALPTNNRPVSLTRAFRHLIATALNMELLRVFEAEPHQWGFQLGSTTDCAIAFAVNNMRCPLRHAALLDIRKAYDTLPRNILQSLVDRHIPSPLSSMIRVLLAPVALRTKDQVSERWVSTLSGTPQGCPPSPTLFNIFMDEYIRTINASPRKLLATLFVDDVALLANSMADLQHGLDLSGGWASRQRMSWAVRKSFGLRLPSAAILAVAELPNKHEEIYLGVSLGPKGVTDTQFLARIAAGISMLALVRLVTDGWKTTVRQRLAVVRTFVLSLIDYALYLQPLSAQVLDRSAQLDSLCDS